jgi:hypothetical protein
MILEILALALLPALGVYIWGHTVGFREGYFLGYQDGAEAAARAEQQEVNRMCL